MYTYYYKTLDGLILLFHNNIIIYCGLTHIYLYVVFIIVNNNSIQRCTAVELTCAFIYGFVCVRFNAISSEY